MPASQHQKPKSDIEISQAATKRPIADAAWRKDRQGLYIDYAKVYEERIAKMHLDAADFKLPWPELALRFTLSIEGVHTAIVGTTNPDHVQANHEIAERGPLPADALTQIRNSFRRADPGGTWKGQT